MQLEVKKKNFAQRLSDELALKISEILKKKGLDGCYPGPEGGKEKRLAGGIGSKKVDVSFVTEEIGLALGISIKTINYKDKRTDNYQKNLTNRRNDLLSESVTLHKRFPFAVLGGLLIFHQGAKEDDTERRSATFKNAKNKLSAFTDRENYRDPEESYEKLGLMTYEMSPEKTYEFTLPDAQEPNISIEDNFFDPLLKKVSQRNPDHFNYLEGEISKS